MGVSRILDDHIQDIGNNKLQYAGGAAAGGLALGGVGYHKGTKVGKVISDTIENGSFKQNYNMGSATRGVKSYHKYVKMTPAERVSYVAGKHGKAGLLAGAILSAPVVYGYNKLTSSEVPVIESIKGF